MVEQGIVNPLIEVQFLVPEPMKNLIISPHTDDAIYSIGAYISKLEDVTILSPFAGIPEDEAGKKKHLILRNEHKQACELLGVKFINGNFLDDVYPKPEERVLVNWLILTTRGYENIYVPTGIFHADHIYIRDLFLKYIPFKYFYQELPYRTAFPELAENIRRVFCSRGELITCESTELKRQACDLYKSQNGDPVMEQIMAQERIFKL